MANAGLSNLPIGLECDHCGHEITVSYIAHGSNAEELISNTLRELVVAAARIAIVEEGLRLCSDCYPLPLVVEI